MLLKGVNDNVETMKKLVHRLLMMRVRPYYLYQCDPITGSAHFRTPVSKGLEIIEGLRGHTTGYAVPNYVIDAPGGGGKIPLAAQLRRRPRRRRPAAAELPRRHVPLSRSAGCIVGSVVDQAGIDQMSMLTTVAVTCRLRPLHADRGYVA